MQHAWKHVERPGGSHTALDGKKTQEQLAALQDWYAASGQHLDPIDATVQGQKSPVPGTFFLHTMWMFGCTKPTREVTAVAQTPPV